MDEPVAIAVAIGLFVSFICAGFLEVRKDPSSLKAPRRAGPLVAAVILSGLLVADIIHPFFSFHPLISTGLAVASLVAAGLAFAGRYQSRLASRITVGAGLFLAVLWSLNHFVS